MHVYQPLVVSLYYRYPVKSFRILKNGAWLTAANTTQSFFVVSSGGPFSFPLTVELTSVMGEKVQDVIKSLNVSL